jgi:hypothetical protein
VLTSLTSVLIASLAVGGLNLGVLPATVASGDGLTAIQARAERATDDRIRAIDQTLERVDSNESLTAEHRDLIVATLTANRTAMLDLQAEVASESDVTDALDAYQRIFTDYRVYAVSLPQTLYAAGADRLTESAIPRLNEAYETLAAEGGDPEGLAELRAAIDTAADLAAGIADAALAVDAADFNDDPTVLADLRLELRDAISAARDALEAARSVLDELR